MDAWQKLGKSLEELWTMPLNGPEDAKKGIEAAYILGMIQSDLNRNFPTEVLMFIRDCQDKENKCMIPYDRCLQERINLINHYKNQQQPLI